MINLEVQPITINTATLPKDVQLATRETEDGTEIIEAWKTYKDHRPMKYLTEFQGAKVVWVDPWKEENNE